MRFEWCDKSPSFFKVRGLTAQLSNYIRFHVKLEYRFFADNAWYVHSSEVVKLTQYAYAVVGHVQYDQLPDDLQMEIASKKPGWTKATPKASLEKVQETPEFLYSKLFLTPDAPEFVVTAVWRALVKKYHPDVGGDAEIFKVLKDVYEKIKEGLNGHTEDS